MKDTYVKATKKAAALLGLCLMTWVADGRASAPRISDVQSYLNSLTTLQASFQQWDHNGGYTEGTLFLKRPGLIRLNYKEPSKLMILGDGTTLFFADRKTGDLSYMPLANSPASFLLKAQINIQRDFNVRSFTFEADKVTLTLVKKDALDIGSLTLSFRRLPTLQLTQWSVTDAQEKNIIVRLSNHKTGVNFPKSLFDSKILSQ